MSYNGVYDVNLSIYKELKQELRFGGYYELKMIAREMIYYNHYMNMIMNSFLSSNDSIENIIKNIEIVSLDDYLDGSDLI